MTFIRWAGKKKKVIDQYRDYFPDTFNCYFEPFLGSGSVFFDFAEKKLLSAKKIYLSDSNQELITAWLILKNDFKALEVQLKSLTLEQKVKGYESAYYFIRAWKPGTSVEVAARFLYLNLCCFNGLYRVNSRGSFNVPIGKRSNGAFIDFLPDFDNLKKCSEILRNLKVNLSALPYMEALQSVTKGDFVYLDPPYDAEGAEFVSYSHNKFDRKDQNLLADKFDLLSAIGAKVALSNSATMWVRDRYSEYPQIEIYRSGCMNSDPDKRQKVKELLILNY